MWTVEAPGYLFLLLLLIPGIYFVHFFPGRGGVIPFPLGIWEGESFRNRRRFWRFLLNFSVFLFWAGTALLLISLAGPVRVEKEQIFLTRGIDILFVLDESPSMAAKDFPPENRFETARNMIADFVRGRENDAIGLVTFSGEAVLRVPPTVDYRSFLARLQELRLMELGEGTSIGLGLAIAALHEQKSTAQEKVIVLLTDGENNSGEIPPLSAARIATELGIRIYAIGIGSEGQIPLEYTDPETGRTYRGMYNSGYNEALLEDIARISGGRYFAATSPGALEQVLRTIDSIESSEKRIKLRTSVTPVHRGIILAGALAVLLSLFIRKILLREVF